MPLAAYVSGPIRPSTVATANLAPFSFVYFEPLTGDMSIFSDVI